MKTHHQLLTDLLADGPLQIGQTVTLPSQGGVGDYRICHVEDFPKVRSGESEHLTVHTNPEDAREIALYAEDGHYRFTKGELTLRSGWLFQLPDLALVRQALEHFHPAAIGLWRAHEENSLRVQNVRDKLNRQTGMYQRAKQISDEGLQNLVATTCGPANCCVKKILWQLDDQTPLAENEASTHEGLLPAQEGIAHVIPLYCQEACNHFVAQARKVSKKEYEQGIKSDG